jgi:hypothetical protein
MNILYITRGNHVDYQNDCTLIGLKELFGSSVVDINKQSHIYTSYSAQEAKKLYGMGMSVTRILPDLEVDRSDITNKIRNKFYDYIVYGSVWRCLDHLDRILEYYPPERVIAIDGEDETNIHPCYGKGLIYFKRELMYMRPRLLPISFAIPTCKLNFTSQKSRDIAFITPQDRSTYIYRDEESYYNDYRESRFAVTMKKAGWDCMRHYEILANGCIPYFIDINKCPELIMQQFPKDLCKKVNILISNNNKDVVYDMMAPLFFKAAYKNSTSALAEYIINSI